MKAKSISFAAVAALVLSLGAAAPTDAQDDVRRAVPSAVTLPQDYRLSVERGWRSEDGAPGHSYWQQWSGYDIDARLDPETGKVEASVQILYAHDAPVNMNSVWLHLHQNLHKEGSPRLSEEEITGGITITRLAADTLEIEERPLEEGPGYQVEGTLLQVRPAIRLEPGDTLQLDIDYEFTVPQNGAGRMGHSDREMYLIAYWFPKMAVFDNVRGWSQQPYLGNAEFYDEFGDYDVEITVPVDWTVMATGDLQNPDEVFSAVTVDRLEEARTSDERVLIAGRAERDALAVTADSDDGWLTYHFVAENVRDFTWTTSNVQQWDASSAVVGDRDGDGADDRALIHSFWREDRAPLWEEQWRYAKQSVEFHSEYTGFPYPWSHFTSVEGTDIIGGGMEYPMMTLIGPYTEAGAQALFNVTSHEIAHMWIPMIVGSDEKRHAWMDEGSTSYLEGESRMDLYPGVDHHRVEARFYLQVANAGLEGSLMRHGDYYEPGPSYTAASYQKPSALMVALREIMGREAWEEAYRAFISEWAYKYPTPYDFFSTFERFAEEDLDWFWTSFYYQTWTVDHAVGTVTTPRGNRGATVTIDDLGIAPFPVVVRIRTTSGERVTHEIPVEHWLDGNTDYVIELESGLGGVTRVEIDPGGWSLDTNRDNNFWPQG